jgi:hypothetical protein
MSRRDSVPVDRTASEDAFVRGVREEEDDEDEEEKQGEDDEGGDEDEAEGYSE